MATVSSAAVDRGDVAPLALDVLSAEAIVGSTSIGAAERESFDVTDPATGGVVASVPRLTDADVAHAVAAAGDALPTWSRLTAKARGRLLRALYEGMLGEKDHLARLIALEQGKPLAQAEGEVDYAASFFEWFAEEAKRAYGQTIPSVLEGHEIVVVREPVGAVAGITPWNFPLAMPARKIAAALAAGCTMVVKPAEQAPLSTLALGRLALECELPAGVLSVVTGAETDADRIGDALIGDPTIRKIGFTGSNEVGKLLMAKCARSLKRVLLELGGSCPVVVFADIDVPQVAAEVVTRKFRNAGQTCVAPNRILVEQNIHDEFVHEVTRLTSALKTGDPFDRSTDVGPLIDEAAVAKVSFHVENAAAKGAELLCGGVPIDQTLFFQPTVITGLTPEMEMWDQETFGPVAAIAPFADQVEAVGLANKTRSGLAAYVYSNDYSRLRTVASALEFGIIGLNTSVISNEVAPFGGMKESGIGREGSHQGLDEWLEVKYLSIAHR